MYFTFFNNNIRRLRRAYMKHTFLSLTDIIRQSAFSWHISEREAIKFPEKELDISDNASQILCISPRLGRSAFESEEMKFQKVTTSMYL